MRSIAIRRAWIVTPIATLHLMPRASGEIERQINQLQSLKRPAYSRESVKQCEKLRRRHAVAGTAAEAAFSYRSAITAKGTGLI
jgi:hypothetical protein